MGKVVTLDVLRRAREEFRRNNKKVVFTNGCFDIIHRGHVEYLSKARTLGDVLVVGMNTDNSTRHIKGTKRPIVTQGDRAYIVANLSPVDYVCLFDDDTPLEIIRDLVPDVLVKGADWDANDIVGKDIVERAGGIVATIDFVPDHSTSSIIDQILKLYS